MPKTTKNSSPIGLDAPAVTETEKLNVEIPAPTMALLKEATIAYEEKFGHSITPAKLLPALVETWLTKDAGFKRWRKARADDGSKSSSAKNGANHAVAGENAQQAAS